MTGSRVWLVALACCALLPALARAQPQPAGELGIVFVDRTEGQSKMSRAIVREAVWMVWRLRFAALRGRLGAPPASPPQLTEERA